MIKLVAIDPGLRGCGLAVFEGQTLQLAQYVPNTSREDRGPFAWFAMARQIALCLDVYCGNLLIEVPRIYQGSKQKGDPDDIVQIAGVVGAISAVRGWGSIVGVHPRDWKGTINPEVMIERFQWFDPREKKRPRLTHAEFDTIERPRAVSLEHNMWDAIGIGLHHLGRLAPNRGSDT